MLMSLFTAARSTKGGLACVSIETALRGSVDPPGDLKLSRTRVPWSREALPYGRPCLCPGRRRPPGVLGGAFGHFSQRPSSGSRRHVARERTHNGLIG